MFASFKAYVILTLVATAMSVVTASNPYQKMKGYPGTPGSSSRNQPAPAQPGVLMHKPNCPHGHKGPLRDTICHTPEPGVQHLPQCPMSQQQYGGHPGAHQHQHQGGGYPMMAQAHQHQPGGYASGYPPQAMMGHQQGGHYPSPYGGHQGMQGYPQMGPGGGGCQGGSCGPGGCPPRPYQK